MYTIYPMRVKRAVTQNVNRSTLDNSLHYEGREEEEGEDEGGLAGWMEGDTNICSPKNKQAPRLWSDWRVVSDRVEEG